jgi:hypothetical protein
MKLPDRILGGFIGFFCGYLLVVMLGCIVFDPNTDIWALLGFVLGIFGLCFGATSGFHKFIPVCISSIMGFYGGSIPGILLFGNPATDDLLEITRTFAVGSAVFGTILGGIAGYLLREKIDIPLSILSVLTGYLGGIFFGIVLRLAEYPSMVGWSPFVLGSGLSCGLILWLLRRRPRKRGHST